MIYWLLTMELYRRRRRAAMGCAKEMVLRNVVISAKVEIIQQ